MKIVSDRWSDTALKVSNPSPYDNPQWVEVRIIEDDGGDDQEWNIHLSSKQARRVARALLKKADEAEA